MRLKACAHVRARFVSVGAAVSQELLLLSDLLGEIAAVLRSEDAAKKFLLLQFSDRGPIAWQAVGIKVTNAYQLLVPIRRFFWHAALRFPEYVTIDWRASAALYRGPVIRIIRPPAGVEGDP
jgi:hypothetical protein